jgi:hypothetical protein
MQTLIQALNQEIAGYEATLHLSNGDTFRIKGDIVPVSDLFISVNLSNNPDKRGRKIVGLNHIVSIDWYTK